MHIGSAMVRLGEDTHIWALFKRLSIKLNLIPSSTTALFHLLCSNFGPQCQTAAIPWLSNAIKLSSMAPRQIPRSV